MHKGDRVKDTLTGSEWTIIQIWTTDPGGRMKWHMLESDRGARRRILTGELEERYQRVPNRG